MKRQLIVVIVLLSAARLIAQDALPQMYAVREVTVRPSKDGAYREAMKKLKDACVQNKLMITWNMFALQDNSYLFARPITKMADLDKPAFAELEAKISKADWDKIWTDLANGRESFTDYIATIVPGMTYLTPPTDDQTYRVFIFVTLETGKDAEFVKNMGEWKAAYQAKNVPQGFIVYQTGFGHEPTYIIQAWGKDALDFETIAKKRNDILGDEVGKLWVKMMSMTKSITWKNGWKVMSLSNAPGK